MRIRQRAGLVISIMAALTAVNPFKSQPSEPSSRMGQLHNPRKETKSTQSRGYFLLPVTKQAFKQNQRKELKASARKKAK